MIINRVRGLFFSPCGSTAGMVIRITEALSSRLGAVSAVTDVTRPAARERAYRFGPDELLIAGFPTYAGRLPNKILPWLRESVKGSDTPAAVTVTFGNRSFDDSLRELALVLDGSGFVPVAAAAVCSRHVFSDDIGTGRPDADDIEGVSAFAERISSLIGDARDIFEFKLRGLSASIPGNDPIGPYYTPLRADGTPAKFLKAVPKTDPSSCDGCGVCADVCPVGSVDRSDFSLITGPCIKCQACVRSCHTGAKYFDDPDFLSHVKMLRENCVQRAESRFFVL